jgi:hypothetical protein
LSQQWIKKDQPGPIKAKMNASQMKQMPLVFFDSKGLIYTHIVPRGATSQRQLHLQGQVPGPSEEEEAGDDLAGVVLSLDNTPVYIATTVKKWFADHSFQLLLHPPYLRDLSMADFSFFRTVKENLAGLSLDEESL